MAFYRKLTEGWRLTDGILPEMEMEAPVGVYEALRENGRLPDAHFGMNAMACEWISARRWVYSLALTAPDEDDERAYVEFPKLAGGGAVYLNGELLASFETGAVRVELTGKMKAEEENLLEIRFAPALYLRPDQSSPVAQIGLQCAPILRTANYVTVETVSLSARNEGEDGVIRAEFGMNVHADGKYTFRYGLICGDEPAVQHELFETLTAGQRTVAHEIRVNKPVWLDTDRLEDTVYGVRFSLERGSVGCDVRHMETAFRKAMKPKRCFAVKEWPLTEETARQMIELGADGAVLCGMPENAFEKNDFLFGLTAAEDGVRMSGTGMISMEKLRDYAAGETCWPISSALWRLRGGETGAADCGELGVEGFVSAMRLSQALQVLAGSEQARREGRAAIAQLDEEYGYFASGALIEKDGCRRPALDLLKERWQASYACCELPEGGCAKPDTLLHLNVWVLAEDMGGSVLSAVVRVMDLSGQEIVSTSFPVMGGDARLAGVMNLRTPSQEGLMIVRTELKNVRGGTVSCIDSILAACEGSPVELLGAVPAVGLARAGVKLKNTGSIAALSAGLCLMPGEETTKAVSEWLNAAAPGAEVIGEEPKNAFGEA